jgi:uncharacterized membrane protein
MLSRWFQSCRPPLSAESRRTKLMLEIGGMTTGVIVVVVITVLAQVFNTTNVFFASMLVLLGVLIVKVDFVVNEVLREKDARNQRP